MAPAPRPKLADKVDKGVLKPDPGIIVAGKFRLERQLGQGSMGSVWVALHVDLDVRVAVKIMMSQAESEADGSDAAEKVSAGRLRFEREAKTVAQLRSANIVRIIDCGVDRRVPYIAMELLEGEDLACRLEREGKLPAGEVARILVPVARALQQAHDAGLVHRDLKPANIFLAREGDEEVPKILDFGVAKPVRPDTTGAEVTQDGLVVGTPAYMSPEQAFGRSDIDHRADLWSLGVIAFRAWTGQKPFDARGAVETIALVLSAPIPKPSDLVPGLPAEADEFIARALQREPEDRYSSARDMARALRPMLPKSNSVFPPAAPAAEESSGVRAEAPGGGDPDRTADQNPAPAPEPKRRTAAIVIGAASVVVLTAAVAAGAALFGGSKPQPAPPSASAPAQVQSAPLAATTASSAPVASVPAPTPSASASTAPTRTPGKPGKPVPVAPHKTLPTGTKSPRDLGY